MPDPARRTDARLEIVQPETLRDSTDLRDMFYRPALLSLPSRYTPAFLQSSTLRSLIHIRDQGVSDRCTGYALASLIDIQRITELIDEDTDGVVAPVSSQMLFEMGAMVSAEIRGAERGGYNIRSAIKGFYHNGVCLESDWPEGQDSSAHDFDAVQCFKRARQHSLGAYFRLEHRLADYHSAIGEVGAVLVSAHLHAGWLRESLEANGRILPADDFADYGAHAFVIVGYDHTGFFVLNSWGEAWGGDVADLGRIAGVAHWSYKDWAESVIDAWVLRLAVPTPDAFEYTQGAHGSAYFGSARSGLPQATADSMAAEPVAVPRQQVLGHYIHFESGNFVPAGNYPDSAENLDRTLAYLRCKFCESVDDDRDVDRVYLRIAGDTGSVKNAMHRISKLRRVLRPKGVYPITLVWTARMASAFAIGIKSCMQEAVARMPDPTSDRNELIEALLRPLGRPLWQQMKIEAASLARIENINPGPLARTFHSLNDTLDERLSITRRAGSKVARSLSRDRIGAAADALPERRIELVVEGAGALVFLAFLNALKDQAIPCFRHVNRIHLAFPVANHRDFVSALKRIRRALGTSRRSRREYNDFASRIVLLRPNRHFLAMSFIGPYTQTWFHLVNNSFESTPAFRGDSYVHDSLSLASDKAHQLELVGLGIQPQQQISAGPKVERQVNGAAILRNSVVDKAFVQSVLSGNWHGEVPDAGSDDTTEAGELAVTFQEQE